MTICEPGRDVGFSTEGRRPRNQQIPDCAALLPSKFCIPKSDIPKQIQHCFAQLPYSIQRSQIALHPQKANPRTNRKHETWLRCYLSEPSDEPTRYHVIFQNPRDPRAVAQIQMASVNTFPNPQIPKDLALSLSSPKPSIALRYKSRVRGNQSKAKQNNAKQREEKKSKPRHDNANQLKLNQRHIQQQNNIAHEEQ